MLFKINLKYNIYLLVIFLLSKSKSNLLLLISPEILSKDNLIIYIK